MRQFLSCTIVAFAAVALSAVAAHAAEDGFEVCNRTKFQLVYAKALNVANKDVSKKDEIVSEGWFDLKPGECHMLYPGKLKYRYYLVYAEAKGSNRKWTGKINVCVQNSTFKLSGETCASNRNHRSFIEVDTGDFDTYTYDLK
jgi:uncharacterized membrane protein